MGAATNVLPEFGVSGCIGSDLACIASFNAADIDRDPVDRIGGIKQVHRPQVVDHAADRLNVGAKAAIFVLFDRHIGLPFGDRTPNVAEEAVSGNRAASEVAA